MKPLTDFNNTPQVELDPELRCRLSKGTVGTMIQHPLVHTFYSPQWNEMYNQQLKWKQEAIAKARNQNDWDKVLTIFIERPYRVRAFIEVKDKLSNETYWSLLSRIFIDSENIWQHLNDWRLLLSSDRPHSHFFMTEEERRFLRDLPDRVTIFRGCTKKNAKGISYTLNREKAEWFARRFNQNGYVKELKVMKAKIFAYKNCRGEDEVIVL